MQPIISETVAVEIAVRHVRENKIDGVFDGAYLTERDGRQYWRVSFELQGVAPEAKTMFGELGILVDLETGEPTIIQNL
jgi:hypothetical protein